MFLELDRNAGQAPAGDIMMVWAQKTFTFKNQSKQVVFFFHHVHMFLSSFCTNLVALIGYATHYLCWTLQIVSVLVWAGGCVYEMKRI